MTFTFFSPKGLRLHCRIKENIFLRLKREVNQIPRRSRLFENQGFVIRIITTKTSFSVFSLSLSLALKSPLPKFTAKLDKKLDRNYIFLYSCRVRCVAGLYCTDFRFFFFPLLPVRAALADGAGRLRTQAPSTSKPLDLLLCARTANDTTAIG